MAGPPWLLCWARSLGRLPARLRRPSWRLEERLSEMPPMSATGTTSSSSPKLSVRKSPRAAASLSPMSPQRAAFKSRNARRRRRGALSPINRRDMRPLQKAKREFCKSSKSRRPLPHRETLARAPDEPRLVVERGLRQAASGAAEPACRLQADPFAGRAAEKIDRQVAIDEEIVLKSSAALIPLPESAATATR